MWPVCGNVQVSVSFVQKEVAQDGCPPGRSDWSPVGDTELHAHLVDELRNRDSELLAVTAPRMALRLSRLQPVLGPARLQEPFAGLGALRHPMLLSARICVSLPNARADREEDCPATAGVAG